MKFERIRVKEGCMLIVEAEYFVFELFVPNFIKNFGHVAKEYVCEVCVLLGVGRR